MLLTVIPASSLLDLRFPQLLFTSPLKAKADECIFMENSIKLYGSFFARRLIFLRRGSGLLLHFRFRRGILFFR